MTLSSLETSKFNFKLLLNLTNCLFQKFRPYGLNKNLKKITQVSTLRLKSMVQTSYQLTVDVELTAVKPTHENFICKTPWK